MILYHNKLHFFLYLIWSSFVLGIQPVSKTRGTGGARELSRAGPGTALPGLPPRPQLPRIRDAPPVLPLSRRCGSRRGRVAGAPVGLRGGPGVGPFAGKSVRAAPPGSSRCPPHPPPRRGDSTQDSPGSPGGERRALPGSDERAAGAARQRRGSRRGGAKDRKAPPGRGVSPPPPG